MNRYAPLSKGASLANVLSGLFKDMREKQQEKNYWLQMENQRLAKNREESQRLNAEKPEVFRPDQSPKLSDKEKLELEKLRAETARIKSETAKNVWDQSGADKLRKAYDEIDFLRKQDKLNRMLYDIEKQSMISKYSGKGVPSQLDEYDELIKMFEGLEDRLYKISITTKEIDDEEGYQNAQKQLIEVRKRLNYLRKNHPVNNLFPKEEAAAMEEQGPSWMQRRWQDVKDIGQEIVEGRVTKNAPAAPKVQGEIPPEPVKKVGKFQLYYATPEWWQGKEDELDYLTWYVATHPEDKRAMRKFQELSGDPDFAWYFVEGRSKRATGGSTGTAG